MDQKKSLYNAIVLQFAKNSFFKRIKQGVQQDRNVKIDIFDPGLMYTGFL